MTEEEARRRAWFEAYVERCERGVMRPPAPGVRYRCPCCGYLTLSARAAYDICCLCNWEDDGQDDPRANEAWGGANGSYSLAEARRNFANHLIMYDPGRPTTRIGGPDSAIELEAKRAMMAAFNAMPTAPDEAALEVLWRTVGEAEATLSSETNRKVKQYESMHEG